MRAFVLFLLIITTCAYAQAPQKFYARYGGNGYDVGYDVRQTLDKGYIITGSTSSYGLGNTDMYLLKLDSMGHHRFQNTFGNANNDIGKAVIQLIDSSYVMVGYTNSIGFGGYDIFLVKADKLGQLVWQKTIGGADWDFANSLQQTTDGGFIIAGSTFSYGYGKEDAYVVKTDANGNTQWSKTFGGIEDDIFKSVVQTTDGGYVLCGSTKSYADINGDAWVFKLNNLGDSVWSKTYGGVKEDFFNSIKNLQNNNLLVGGSTKSTSVGGNFETKFSVLNLIDGIETHTYTDLSSVDEYYNDIEQGLNGYVVACGLTKSLLYSDDGVVDIYSTTYGYFNAYSIGGNTMDDLFAVCKTKDKGYAIVGRTTSYGAILEDVFFIKTDSTGAYGNNITSIKNINNDSFMLSVFPNPATNTVFVKTNGVTKYNSLNCKIITVTGTELLNQKIYEETTPLNLENITNGMYYVIFYNGTNLLKTEKISIIK